MVEWLVECIALMAKTDLAIFSGPRMRFQADQILFSFNQESGASRINSVHSRFQNV